MTSVNSDRKANKTIYLAETQVGNVFAFPPESKPWGICPFLPPHSLLLEFLSCHWPLTAGNKDGSKQRSTGATGLGMWLLLQGVELSVALLPTTLEGQGWGVGGGTGPCPFSIA